MKTNQDRITVLNKAEVTVKRRFSLVAILFLFMLLHQTDKLLIGPLTTPIMETYGINEAEMGMVFTGAALVGGIFYPIWGYLFDRYARQKVLALASAIWGATTWLSAIAPNFGIFTATRASTGIDDASYPGAYSLVSDYFDPTKRGKIIGILQLTMVIGGIVSMGLVTAFRHTLGWRMIFYITGGLGIAMALVILLGIKEIPRGQSEPEMEKMDKVVTKRFSWSTVKHLAKRPSLVLMFVQQYFHVLPFYAISSWFFRYLEVERQLPDGEVFLTAGLFAFMTAISGVVAGALGDWLFKKNPRGRIIVAIIGMLGMLTFFNLALKTPNDNQPQFLLLVSLSGFFMSFEWPNAISTVQDITEPEVRSVAHGIIGVSETIGSAFSPLVVGLIAVSFSLGQAMQWVTMIAWVCSLILLGIVMVILPKDVYALREVMRSRVEQ